MSRALQIRKLGPEKHNTLEKWAHSRTAAARLVKRARFPLLANQGYRVPAIAQPLQLTAITVRPWLKRFNAAGLAALTNKQRSERPATYNVSQLAEAIATSLTPPAHLGLPFASWPLERWAAYLHAHKGIAIKRSRMEA